MIDFKMIEKAQINEFKRYLDCENAIACDMNMLNAYLWRYEFGIKFAVADDALIKAYFRRDGSVWGYCMPAGKNVTGAFEAIFDDANERGGRAHIVMLTGEQRAQLEELYPGKFTYVRSPENQDYIYLSEELASLSGKKFHAKRNHISKFNKAYPDSRLEPLCKSNEDDAVAVVRAWCEENGINPDEHDEFAVIREALGLMDEYNMRGAVLYVRQKPVAMTLGSEISELAYDINFEKALREYDGSYAVINNLFAKTLTQYKYINREEDMGLEGLRKSKLSYKPCIILDRFNALLKQ